MEKYDSIIKILSFVCGCLIVGGSATQAGAAIMAPPNSGRLLVYRAAKFGYRVNLILSVDGKNVASLTEGQSYDAYLPAGQHVLVARITPNKTGTHPGRQTMTIQAGHTYSYIATLSGTNLALVKKK